MMLAVLWFGVAGMSGPVMAQDAAGGGAIFQQRCQMCHVTAPGAKAVMAPSLRGLPNRMAASTSFAYSAALKQSGLKWTAANLDRFLAAPSKLVPGTRMIVSVPDPAKRAQLVAYLMTLK